MEDIVVSLTSWKPRFENLPVVLDTIFEQTHKPDLVVLNLAFDDDLPDYLSSYVEKHGIEIFRVKDTKVYKKLIPTLKRYPQACVISIDDDFLYPKEMIQDFVEVHRMFPNLPISGNQISNFGMQCHCGCASLTKASFFGQYLEKIDDDLIRNCFSDDIVYTFLSTKAGFPYIRTKGLYFTNMEPYRALNPYSKDDPKNKKLKSTYLYLKKRFGDIGKFWNDYIDNGNRITAMYEETLSARRRYYKRSHQYLEAILLFLQS